MLQFFDAYANLFQSWSVIRYEREGESYLLQITAVLKDNSRLEIRDYLFADGSRKYAYHWMTVDGRLQQRWDNAPHWPDIVTNPHHTHLPGREMPQPSTITNIESLIQFLDNQLNRPD